MLDEQDVGFRFRHALTRDAVLAASLRPELARMAAATGVASARLIRTCPASGVCSPPTWPSRPATGRARQRCWCALDAARWDRRRWAARKGWRAARWSSDRHHRTAPSRPSCWPRCWLRCWVDDAAEVVRGALDVLDGRNPARSARLSLLLVRAAVAAEHWALADDRLDQLRRVGALDPALTAEIAALDAQSAIGRGDIERARRLAMDAVTMANRAGSIEAACAAWEVLGRAERSHSLPAARAAFQRGAALAQEHGARAVAAAGHPRARHHRDARRRAARHPRAGPHARGRRRRADRRGDHRSAVVRGYHLLGRADDVAAAGSRATKTGRQLRVSGIERAGTCLTVLRHALRGDRAALERAVATAQRLVDQDAGMVGVVVRRRKGDGRDSLRGPSRSDQSLGTSRRRAPVR